MALEAIHPHPKLLSKLRRKEQKYLVCCKLQMGAGVVNILLLSQSLWQAWKLEKVVILGDVPEVDFDLYDFFDSMGQRINGLALGGGEDEEQQTVSDSSLHVVRDKRDKYLDRYAKISNNFTLGVWLFPFLSRDELSKVNLRLDSNFYFLESFSSSEELSLVEAYSIKGGLPITRKIGSWYPPNQLILANEAMWIRRKDLLGVNLVYSALPYAFFSIISLAQDGSTISLHSGAIPEIMDHLSRALNFTMSGIVPPDNSWGAQDASGNWTGLVGQLTSNEVDMVTGGLVNDENRAKVISISIGIIQETFTLSMKRKSGGSFNITAYIDLLYPTTWLTIILSGLIVALLFLLIQALEVETFHDNEEKFSFLSAISLVALVLLQLSHPISVNKGPSRILFYSLCMGSFLLFGFYTADLTSLMTAASPAMDVNTLEEVVTLHGYQVIVFKASAAAALFENSNPSQPYYNPYQLTMKSNPNAYIDYSVDIAEHLLQNENLAFFGLKNYFVGQSDIVQADVLGSYNIELGIALQKNSEFLPMFNYYLTKMRESGLAGRVLRKWEESTSMSLKGTDQETQPTTATALSFTNVMLPFLFMISGIVVAISCSLFEFVIHRISNKI